MWLFLVDLYTALTADSLSGILNNPGALQALQSHLPAVEGDPQEALRSTINSPQFQQVINWLGWNEFFNLNFLGCIPIL